MPLFPIVALPSASPPLSAKLAQLSGLKIAYHSYVQNFAANTITFRGGVIVTYGPTRVVSDSLDLDLTHETGDSRGHVHLSDPVGNLDCDELDYSWTTHKGLAKNVHIVANSLKIDVESIVVRPEAWTLYNAHARGFAGRVVAVEIQSKKIEVLPGRYMVMRRPSLGTLGAMAGPFFDSRSDLSNSTLGLNYPALSFKQGQGVGVSWQSEFAMGPSGLLDAGYRNYKLAAPSYQLEASSTLLRPSQDPRMGAPPNELGDRFGDSYFQNALVASEDAERADVGAHRENVAINTAANSQPMARDTDARYDKPMELVYERSDQVGSFDWRGQLRWQSIRRDHGPLERRGFLWVTGMGPTWRLAPKLNAYSRLDGQVFSQSGFAWGRGQAGLTYRPITFLRVGAAGFWGGQKGMADFPVDDLDREFGYVGRADLLSGPTRFSYLLKYDPRTGSLYDREFSFRQAIGILDAYVDFRRNPSQFRYGLMFRLNSLLDSVSSRSPHRPAPDDGD
jgi:hypothetical protein